MRSRFDSTPTAHQEGNCAFLAWDSRVSCQWFDPTAESLQARPVTRGGRGSAWYINLPDDVEAVLRLSRRGGLVARLSKDLYCWAGRARARSFKEFETLARLHKNGLKVPCPIAAMVCRVGFVFYRAGLITQRIQEAQPLCVFEDPDVWSRAGSAIRRMHDLGVWHADLNVHNIQIDGQGDIWLIDFDRAQENVNDAKRLHANLQRLERSAIKNCAHLHPRCWSMLLAGYAESPDLRSLEHDGVTQ